MGDDTMIRKYKKQEDGIVLNKENLPLICDELLKLKITRVKYDIGDEKLWVSLLGGEEKCVDFGAVMKFSKNGINVTYPDCSDYYTAITVWANGIKGLIGLYNAKNVKNIRLYDTTNNHKGRIKIDLENGDSFGEELIDTILVFDSEGEFVELVSSPSLSPDTDMGKHGYVRVYDESVE